MSIETREHGEYLRIVSIESREHGEYLVTLRGNIHLESSRGYSENIRSLLR